MKTKNKKNNKAKQTNKRTKTLNKNKKRPHNKQIRTKTNTPKSPVEIWNDDIVQWRNISRTRYVSDMKHILIYNGLLWNRNGEFKRAYFNHYCSQSLLFRTTVPGLEISAVLVQAGHLWSSINSLIIKVVLFTILANKPTLEYPNMNVSVKPCHFSIRWSICESQINKNNSQNLSLTVTTTTTNACNDANSRRKWADSVELNRDLFHKIWHYSIIITIK